LAFWIEVESEGDANSKRVLFDTGQTPEVLLHNAELLGIDLSSADVVVLSHGHYDHTGGLREVLRQAGEVPLFLHPGSLAQRFSRQKDGSVQEIGMPPPLDQGFLGAHASSLVWTDQSVRVTDGLRVTGSVPRATDYEDTGGDFYLDGSAVPPIPSKTTRRSSSTLGRGL
jgi:7,8-dihydropterin-6-yl-methyl-4-(beta-D-ribofuranosyl)aminobenzene 5'-phosphate synthase